MTAAPLHRYRSTTCGGLRKANVGTPARLSGWVHRVRDHGGVLFIDLRDHYGITQVVADPDSKAFKMAEAVRSEWVIRVDGNVRDRPGGTANADLPTGEIEMYATEIDTDVAGSAGGSDSMMDREHPLAGELRKVLQNRDAKTVGDLAKVVEHLMREMAFLKG